MFPVKAQRQTDAQVYDDVTQVKLGYCLDVLKTSE